MYICALNSNRATILHLNVRFWNLLWGGGSEASQTYLTARQKGGVGMKLSPFTSTYDTLEGDNGHSSMVKLALVMA